MEVAEAKTAASNGNVVKIAGIEVGKEDSQNVLEMLFMKKELESINKFATEELKLKEGVKDYRDVSKTESKKKVAYYDASIGLKKEKLDQALGKISGTREELEKRLNVKKRQEQDAKKEWDESKKRKAARGPILDIDVFMGDLVEQKPKKSTIERVKKDDSIEVINQIKQLNNNN